MGPTDVVKKRTNKMKKGDEQSPSLAYCHQALFQTEKGTVVSSFHGLDAVALHLHLHSIQRAHLPCSAFKCGSWLTWPHDDGLKSEFMYSAHICTIDACLFLHIYFHWTVRHTASDATNKNIFIFEPQSLLF